MDKEKSKMARASIGYLIGNYCIKGIGFITVPIFARLLTTYDFGTYNTFLSYEAILYLFIEFALHESLKNAKYKFDNKLDEYTSSVLLLPIFSCLFFSIIAFIFRNQLAILLNLDYSLILLLVIYSFCSGVLIYYRYRIALDYKYKEYLFISGFNVIVNIGLSIFLILTVFKECGYLGRIIGGTTSIVILTSYIIIKLFKNAKPKINKSYLLYGLKIGLPLIPHGLSQIILLQFDRIMISQFTNNSDVGLYSFAYTIYTIMQITGTSLQTSYEPWAFKQLNNGCDGKNNLRRISTCYMIILGGLSTVTMLLCPEIIRILGGEKYQSSIYCAIPILLSGFFAMSYGIPSVIEYYKEKTIYVAIATIFAAICNCVLNAVFIPTYGYIAAAYTTLVSYVLYFIIHLFLSRKLSGFNVLYMKYLCLIIIILCISFIVSLLMVDYFFIRLLLVALFTFLGLNMLVKVYGKKIDVKKFLKKEY